MADPNIDLIDFLNEAELPHYFYTIKHNLKINKTSQLKYVTQEDLDSVGMSRPEQRRLKKFFSKHYPQNYLSKIKKLLKRDETVYAGMGPLAEERSQELGSSSASEGGPPVPRVPFRHIISSINITLNKELGRGEFGVVQQGVWTNDGQRIQVAIKCLCAERMQSNSMEFLKEAAIMHSIEHPSIVRLYGVANHPEAIMLVTELAPLRSLLECLKELSLRASFPILTLCDFALQICEGMAYLEKKRLIHRDLAARNILVFTKNRVKVSDFGLSRALGVGKDYYQTNFNVNLKLPIAWCAPECISFLRFTSASDVWAYAVTLWEMFSYGFQPWAGFSGHEILLTIDAPNYQRLEQPECCPREYFNLMQNCWEHEPSKRPKFSDILEFLPEFKPEQVQAIADGKFDPLIKKAEQLEYEIGDIITVLDKGAAPGLWKGVLSNGTTGYFKSSTIVSYLGSSLPSSTQGMSAPAVPAGGGGIRKSLLRADKERASSRRRLRSDMISAPQGEVRHTGHVGLDGAYFGDVSFLEYNGLPHQVVNPYRPSEDLEQTPLINPNSPSHLTGNNPILVREASAQTSDRELRSRNYRARLSHEEEDTDGDNHGVPTVQPASFPNSNLGMDNLLGRRLSNRITPATQTTCRSNHIDNNNEPRSYLGNTADEPAEAELPTDVQQHEYQEISDEEDQKQTDFGQSLLDEMESMFRNWGGANKSLSGAASSHAPPHHEHAHPASRLSELPELTADLDDSLSMNKRVKDISAEDKRALESAIAFANELTAKSMTDLDNNEPPNTPTTLSERSKFLFRFPGHSQGGTLKSDSTLKANDGAAAKMKNRSFSQEAQSVPDIQSSLTEESRLAYESLVEQPAKYVMTLMKIKHKQVPQLSALPKVSYDHDRVPSDSEAVLHSPTEKTHPKSHAAETADARVSNYVQVYFPDYGDSSLNVTQDHQNDNSVNPLPLPPRDRSKPQEKSRKRHTRKYPLIIQDANLQKTLQRLSQHTSDEELTPTEAHQPPPYPTTAKQEKENLDDFLLRSYIFKAVNLQKPPSPGYGNYQNVDRNLIDNSLDTASLKFEAQLENNFISVDCCDGASFDCDFSHHGNSNEQPNTKLTCKGVDSNLLECQESLSCDNAMNVAEKFFPDVTSNNHDLISKDSAEPVGMEDERHAKSCSFDLPCTTSYSHNSLSHVDDWSYKRTSMGESIDEIQAKMFTKESPDRVSVEDLLEFADQKPCGRQRGTESDEVRIMCKVLKQRVSPEVCVETLEFTSWDVLRAIKLSRLRSMALQELTLPEVAAALESCGWDVARAAALLAAHRDATDIAQV